MGMSPDRGSSPRKNIDPLSPFVQLVTPTPDLTIGGAETIDTRGEETKAHVFVSSSLAVESLDDTLAEEFPLLDLRSLREMREAMDVFIATIRDDVSRDFFGDAVADEVGGRAVSIRYGPARLSSLRAPLVWVECRCQDTEAYLIPHVSIGEGGAQWFHDQSDNVPERFDFGPARLIVELDQKTLDVVSCRPLVSPQCSLEAEQNFLVAVQRRGVGTSSYLLSQYHEFIIQEEISSGWLSADPTELERRAFLSQLSRPSVLGVSTTSGHEWTVSLGYPEHDGRAAYQERVSLREVSPWGLTVTGVTRLP